MGPWQNVLSCFVLNCLPQLKKLAWQNLLPQIIYSYFFFSCLQPQHIIQNLRF